MAKGMKGKAGKGLSKGGGGKSSKGGMIHSPMNSIAKKGSKGC